MSPPRSPRSASSAGHARPIPGAPQPARRVIYGRHAVAAALANPARRWRRLFALAGREAEARSLAAAARAEGAPVRVLEAAEFARLLPLGAVHQGLALEVEPLAEPSLEDILQGAESAPAPCVILCLDQVSDPQNVGAVLRSAAAFGALAVVTAAHGSPPAEGALAKAASGALEIIPLLRVVNLTRALDAIKSSGFWVFGLDETASDLLPGLDLGERVALVFGSEGKGLRRLVRERCDRLARLPTNGALATLNVSNAAAVALYEIRRRG